MSSSNDPNREEQQSDSEFYDANENANEERVFVRECSSNESDSETAEQLASLKNKMENFIIEDQFSNQTPHTSGSNENEDDNEKSKPVDFQNRKLLLFLFFNFLIFFKFVPLHQRLNEELRSQERHPKDSDDEESEQAKPNDPHYIDEEELKKQEEELTDEQKKERLNEAQAIKNTGNELFKQENLQEALETYTKALRICPISSKKERSVFHSNRSACYYKLVKVPFNFTFILRRELEYSFLTC
jgi:hypothetical protein